MRTHAALLALLLAGCTPASEGAAPSDQPASAPRAETATRARAASRADTTWMTGAAGLRWGAGVDEIISRQGEPAFRGKDHEDVTLLGYPVTLAGQQTHVMFFAHPRHGMFRVGNIAEFTGPAECSFKLGLFDQGISRSYPSLQPREQRLGGAGDPCTAFTQGRGGYMKRWTDPSNGARVLLALLPGTSAVTLTYTTAEADQWEQRKARGQF